MARGQALRGCSGGWDLGGGPGGLKGLWGYLGGGVRFLKWGVLGKGQKENWWRVGLGRPVVRSPTGVDVGGSIVLESGEKAGGIDAFCRRYSSNWRISVWNGQWTPEILTVFPRSIPVPLTQRRHRSVLLLGEP